MAFLQFGILLFFAAALTLEHVKAEDDDLFLNNEHYDLKAHKFKQNVFQVLEDICPNKSVVLEETLANAYTCLNGIQEDEKMMCEVFQESKPCVKPIIDLLELCALPAQKGAYSHLMETGYALADYVCNLNGEHFFELTNPCIVKLTTPTFRRCMRRLKKQQSKYVIQNIPPKAETCSFVKNFKNCFETNLYSSCKSNTTREALMGVYNTLLCK